MLSVMGTEGCLSLGFMDLVKWRRKGWMVVKVEELLGFVNADDEELMWVDMV